jgi:hypothetical protein
MRLKVSDNRRFLVYEDGTPFFYLGDTAWELFHRLTFEEAKYYLRDRAAKGFTVIQAVALAEFDGLNEPNRYGHTPLHNNDPTKPNEDYFAHVDRVVQYAESLGLTIGMLPTWGDKWNKKWGVGPEIFTPENARAYGEFLGKRYRNASLIWILGGDRPVETDTHRAILRAMAEGLASGDSGAHLRTFHPPGTHSSTEYLPDEPWLDFHMYQTGHGRERPTWQLLAQDYAHQPTKPCMDAEPGYEDHPIDFNPQKGYLDANDVRRFAYWSMFSGAFGHTYGCHDIWQFYDPTQHPPISWARTPWQEALHLHGAGQMRHLRKLIESRPFLSRVPDQSLLAADADDPLHHIAVTRDRENRYALFYLPYGGRFVANLSPLAEQRFRAQWLDPRTGVYYLLGEIGTGGEIEFIAPSAGKGEDWVLVLDKV